MKTMYFHDDYGKTHQFEVEDDEVSFGLAALCPECSGERVVSRIDDDAGHYWCSEPDKLGDYGPVHPIPSRTFTVKPRIEIDIIRSTHP